VVVFFVVIFLTKNETVYKNAYQENGLVYSGTEKVGDLVNRDTDGDGVSDWQEGLFGTSPTKKDTNDDGIPDNVEIAKISGKIPKNGELNLNNLENIDTTTNTEQLSREIFSTVATLTQTGIIDQNTIDKLSQSLANKIESSSEQKMLTLNDLKITKTDTLQDVKNYSDALNKINNKYPNPGTSVLKTIDKFIVDEDTVDDSALLDMDKIVKYIDNLINEMKNVETPPSLAPLHLNVLNTMQKITENLNTIKLYESDPLSAMNGVSQYGSNMVILESGLDKLINAIEERL
jgi:hypothetical protein